MDVTQYIAEWKKSSEFVRGYTHDFRELDTIGNAQYPKSSGKKVNVGDTTIAGAIRQMMRRAVKKLPVISAAINGSKKTEQALICKFIVNDNILNPTTFGKGFINSVRLGGRGAITRGFNAFQVKATKLYGQFGITPSLIHFSDLGIEGGIQDANLSNFHYVKTNFTPTKLEKIYKREKKNINTTWDIKAVKALLDAGPDGSGQSEYDEWLIPSQSGSDTSSETFTLITRYSADPEDDIVTFSPSLKKALRGVPNRSKFGFPRVLFLVIDPAELSPLGDSRVRLASPNQNLAMALRQNVATTWLYNSDPAVLQTGAFTSATGLKPGARLASLDNQANIKLLNLDTTTAQQYSQISQEISGQILNMLGYNPSANLGAIGESKTGVGAQTQRMAIDESSQEITGIIEDFIKMYILSALDLFLSEQDGEGILYVDDDTRDAIMKINPERFPDPANPNALGVNWDELYDYIQKIDITVDTTISKDEFTDEKRKDLQDALVVMKQTGDPNDPNARARASAVEDELLDEMLPEMPDIEPQPAMPQPEQMMAPQQMM